MSRPKSVAPDAIVEHLNDLEATLKLQDQAVAVDCEAMGLKHKRDRLCLVQLSAGDGVVHLVRFDGTKTDAPKLKTLLANPEVVKIFHFARFDVAALAVTLNVLPAPVFCTKIASRLARTYANDHGLRDLCRELLNVDVSKTQQSSDWGRPDLSDAQKRYAAADVLHLHRLKTELERMLQRENRLHLAQACFDFLPRRAQLDIAGWEDEDIFAHK